MSLKEEIFAGTLNNCVWKQLSPWVPVLLSQPKQWLRGCVTNWDGKKRVWSWEFLHSIRAGLQLRSQAGNPQTSYWLLLVMVIPLLAGTKSKLTTSKGIQILKLWLYPSMQCMVCVSVWSPQPGAPAAPGMWPRGWGVPELEHFHLRGCLLEGAASSAAVELNVS